MSVDVVYTDFSKAFDKVDQYILLNKLAAMGFSNSLLLFLKSYIQNRMQYVDIQGYQSYKFKAIIGAPQGSNLAPLIFLRFINAITGIIPSSVLIFADDVKLFWLIRNRNDALELQGDIDIVWN